MIMMMTIRISLMKNGHYNVMMIPIKIMMVHFQVGIDSLEAEEDAGEEY